MDKNRIIIYGFGNPGRQDDGLGTAIISRLQSEQIQRTNTDRYHQLDVEDAQGITAREPAL